MIFGVIWNPHNERPVDVCPSLSDIPFPCSSPSSCPGNTFTRRLWFRRPWSRHAIERWRRDPQNSWKQNVWSLWHKPVDSTLTAATPSPYIFIVFYSPDPSALWGFTHAVYLLPCIFDALIISVFKNIAERKHKHKIRCFTIYNRICSYIDPKGKYCTR